MRISTASQFQNSLQNIQTNYANLSKIQNELSSGQKLQVASDDPLAMSQVMQNNVQNAA